MSLFKFWGKHKTNENDVGFRDDFTEMDEFELPHWARTTIYLLTCFFIAILVWACTAKIDKIVRAPGKLVTTGNEIVLRPLVDSVVKSIDVRIGQVMKKGQKILTLDPTFSQSDVGQLDVKIETAKAASYRIDCELKHKEFIMPAEDQYGIYLLQNSLFSQRKLEFNSKIRSYEAQLLSIKEAIRSAKAQLVEIKKQIEYADQIRKMRQEVYDSGYDTKLNLLKAQNDYSQYVNQAETLQKTIVSSEFEMKRLTSEKEAFTSDWNKNLTLELAKNNSELETYRKQLNKAEFLSHMVDMTAPQDSVILEIGRISVGSVIKTGEPMVTLIPLNEPIEAEAHIASRDVGFIREGDLCKVKIDAFPFQKHGELKGKLKSIGEDTVNDNVTREPYYVGRITLSSKKLDKVPADTRLIPGMSLLAEIVVGKRTVISYILYPMISVFDESIREP